MNSVEDYNTAAIGERIEAYAIRGEEHNVLKRRVGLDLWLQISSIGEFMVNIVTKNYYKIENLEFELDEIDHPHRAISEPITLEQRERMY